ncbi:hypothetical protein [Leptolyngbya ohadii]|uniref:hypothetical protein n=1 Tax=Leptolyngbya ohadii TaxID=1962290 RepID=UPI000B5A184C|nr:hypothetical protein [Leptolyngbya ohadii]
MDRSKLVAIITGVIALAISIAYLLLVQFLDFRGEMVPAPLDMTLNQTLIRSIAPQLQYQFQHQFHSVGK